MEALQRYASRFEALDAAAVAQLDEIMSDSIRFVDPFNDVRGIEPVKRLFDHMFDSLEDARFTVTHAAMDSMTADTGMLGWELNARFRGKPYRVVGMSEVTIGSDGRISQHIDHWDAGRQFYERLPIVGSLLRGIRKRLKIS
jgi:hypothetical protein